MQAIDHGLALRFLRFFCAFSALLIATSNAIAQNHWNSPVSINIADYLDAGDAAGNFRLGAQPNLSVNVYWNANGEAVIFAGTLAGGWSNGDANSLAWEFTYTVKVVQLESGTAQIAIEWSRRSITGQIQRGLKPWGRIKQSNLGDVDSSSGAPDPNAPTANRDISSSAILSGSGGSGHWETYTFYYTVGVWDPAAWKYYVIGCTSTVSVWVSDGNSGGQEQMQ